MRGARPRSKKKENFRSGRSKTQRLLSLSLSQPSLFRSIWFHLARSLASIAMSSTGPALKKQKKMDEERRLGGKRRERGID